MLSSLYSYVTLIAMILVWLPANAKAAQEHPRMPGFLQPRGRHAWSSRLLTSSCSSPGHHHYLGSETEDKASLSLSNSVL